MGVLAVLDALQHRLYGESGGGASPEDHRPDPVVFARFGQGPDPGADPDKPGQEGPGPQAGEGGETSRALDALLVLEAVALAGSGGPGGEDRPGESGNGAGTRLGSLILAVGLPADGVLEILEQLERARLVDGGPRFRCFRLTPAGEEALAGLGIDVSELRNSAQESGRGDLPGSPPPAGAPDRFGSAS